MNGEKNRYKQYRNSITRLVHISKSEYLQMYFENNMTNMKKTWDGINSLINNKRKQGKQISALKDNSNRRTIQCKGSTKTAQYYEQTFFNCRFESCDQSS